ncbi:MAG: threonine synthase [Acidobacteriota bacterium]
MAFVSTRDPDGPRYGLAEALRLGPAPDGGLFMPERLDPLPAELLDDLPGRPLAETATGVLEHLVGDDLPAGVLGPLAAEALDFPIPVVPLRDRLALLELFHGPTLAFKDVGARFLARLLAVTRDGDGPCTVLVATSGDTGGAVAQAFHGVAGVRVAVLYPAGKVSPLQERQFTTLGGNVRAFAVDGVFDDCQRLVNEAFADRALATELGLTSANSINVGRLLPQILYYLHAASQVEPGRRVLFCTPSGNFGNLTAGLMAKRLGLPCRFLAATNANDVVPAYLETGLFEPRPSVPTLSNAMDVGHPNNFPRILHLYGGDLHALRRDVRGLRFDDGATRGAIARVFRDHGYLLDPHTAVGVLAMEAVLPEEPEDTLGIVLSTAHPAKFAEGVEPVIGRSVPIPEALARHLDAEVRSEPLPAHVDALRQRLRSWSRP